MQRQIDMIRTLESNIRQRSPFSGAESLFPTWKECLGQARLSAELQGSYRRGIQAYSDFCRRHRPEVTVETARRFMAESAGFGRVGTLAAETVGVWNETLNWFFREGGASGAGVAQGADPWAG